MKMQQFEYFMAVSKTGSLGQAASQLFTSQPNVSKVIRSLEEELGHELFLRTSRGVKLNEYGRSIYDYVNSILQNAALISDIMNREPKDVFSVATYQSNTLAKLLADLYMEMPTLHIIHRQGNIEEIVHYVEQQGAEIGMTFISTKHIQALLNVLSGKHLEFVELKKGRACIRIGEKSPYYNNKSVSYNDLSSLRFVRGVQDYFSDNDFSYENIGLGANDAFTTQVSTNCNLMFEYLVGETDLADFSIVTKFHAPGHDDSIHTIDIEGDEADLSIGYIKEKDKELSKPALRYIELVKTNYIM